MLNVKSAAKAAGFRPIKATDLAILLYHVYVASRDPDIGFEDTNETLDTLTGKMNREMQIDLPLLESALWSCNLMDEAGRFWHPREMTFKQFVKYLFPEETFNHIYNILEKKHGN